MDWTQIISHLAPEAATTVTEAFNTATTVFDDFNLNTPLRQAHFLAQAAHETGAFTALEENLNYSAKGLLATFPHYFQDGSTAARFARNPEAIANRVYSRRMGNSQPGDGWKYRGRGVFQLTGRSNYEAMGTRAMLPLLIQPILAMSSRYLLPIALHFWNSRGLSALADQDDLSTITRMINGGENGLPDRAAWLAKFKEALNG